MRKWLNNYFNFSKREYNGILVMLALLGLLQMVPYFYQLLIPEKPDSAAELAAIDQLVWFEKKPELQGYRPRIKRQQRLFKFDPNRTSLAQWQMLGLSAKQAAVLLRYREKGGRFRSKADLKKMYTISPDLYKRIHPYIAITLRDSLPSIGYNGTKRGNLGLSIDPVSIDLNTADSVQLLSVKGIGPAFASRILRYRGRLGAFYKKEQLMEVFGLDSVKYAGIKDQLRLDNSVLKSISINKIEFNDLKGHPYLNFKQINAIIQYRKQHGNYSNFEELKKVAILSAETVDKLAPYISFEP